MSKFDDSMVNIMQIRSQFPILARSLAVIAEQMEKAKKAIEDSIKVIDGKAKKEKEDEDALAKLKEALK